MVKKWKLNATPTLADPWRSWTTYEPGDEYSDVVAYVVAGPNVGTWTAKRRKGYEPPPHIATFGGRASTVDEARDAALSAINRYRASVGERPLPPLPEETMRSMDDVRNFERDRIIKLRREQERERRRNMINVESGYYPDLLIEEGKVRGGRDEELISHSDHIRHYGSSDRRWHRFVYMHHGEPVSALTLIAKRAFRGKQSATIDRVFTHPDHRRKGYAAALLEVARKYFSEVKHSKDLTNYGKKWKARVG